jgi:hypothetical protein
MRVFFISVVAIALLSNVTGKGAAAEPAATTIITWEKTMLEAYTAAVDRQKPLVVLLAHRPSFLGSNGRSYSNEQWMEFDKKELRGFAGKAVFLVAYFDADSGKMIDDKAEIIRAKLEITNFPCTVVVAPNEIRLVEVQRFKGLTDAPDLAKALRKALPDALEAEALAATAK